ncbi:MAG: hypothetical protein V4629_03180 [Pseudomonadota bacterium]
MGSITIDGKTYHGNNISVTARGVYIDGVNADDKDKREIRSVNITVEGNVESIDCASALELSCSGSINFARAGNSVRCGNVRGNVEAGNSVNCGDVIGNVKAGNCVTRR